MARQLRYASANFGALASNPLHSFSAPYAIQHFDSGAVYSFIPKNGCSTMRFSLALANGCISGPGQFNWIHRNNLTFAASLREIVTAPYAFTILRCPFSRLASAFLDKIVSRERPFWSFTDAMNDKSAGDAITFRKFVDLLERPRILHADPHWRPQIGFLVLKEYDDYFQLEDFEAMRARLMQRIGLEIHDARELSRHGVSSKKVVKDTIVSDTPVEELYAAKVAGQVPDLGCFYDEAIRQKVRTIYKSDFECRAELFGANAWSL